MILVGFFISVCWAQDPYHINVLDSFPSPCPHPFGLCWDNGYLWVCDSSTSYFYKLMGHSPIDSFLSPFPHSSGMGCIDDTLYGCALWTLFKMDREGNLLSSCELPDSVTAANSKLGGVTANGDEVWVSHIAGYSSRLYCVDREDCSIYQELLTGGSSRPFGLNYVRDHFWLVNDTWTVLELDTLNGFQTGWFEAPCHFPKGVTYDGQYFWLSDCIYGMIYQVEIIEWYVHDAYPENLMVEPWLGVVYPNPFQTSTRLTYSTKNRNGCNITVYNILGQAVCHPVQDHQLKESGVITWNGQNDQGKDMEKGLYFIVLESSSVSLARKVLLMR